MGSLEHHQEDSWSHTCFFWSIIISNCNRMQFLKQCPKAKVLPAVALAQWSPEVMRRAVLGIPSCVFAKKYSPQQKYIHTHTGTLCLHVDQPPAACSPLPFSPPEGQMKAGQRAQSPVLNGSLGFSWNLPVVLRMDRSHTPLLIHC